MCVDHKIICRCGRAAASFNLRDEIMPVEVIRGLYCPGCSVGIALDPGSMIADNGWVIDYDMDIAGFASLNRVANLPASGVTAEFLFDEGYCTWKGLYPGDAEDSAREKAELLELSRQDRLKYIREFRRWTLDRIARLAGMGWRKAQAADLD
ncbi:MAG: hypothetical protein M0Z48_00330 [Nitrospiraceae bacterium]|nr:hypothetical protein [Nitrospiraceae bacterium]